MEKEVRAIVEHFYKNEKNDTIVESKLSRGMCKVGDEFIIKRIDFNHTNWIESEFYLKSKDGGMHFAITSDELINFFKLKQPKDPINGKIKESEKKAPEFWYVDIVEEKDSELLPKFKKWYLKKINTRIDFIYSKYGFSGWRSFNGYDWISIRGWEANSDKMQKITLNQWNNWFNK
jgi:hypothetical protein